MFILFYKSSTDDHLLVSVSYAYCKLQTSMSSLVLMVDRLS